MPQKPPKLGGMGLQTIAEHGPYSVNRPKPDLMYRTGTAASRNHRKLNVQRLIIRSNHSRLVSIQLKEEV